MIVIELELELEWGGFCAGTSPGQVRQGRFFVGISQDLFILGSQAPHRTAL